VSSELDIEPLVERWENFSHKVSQSLKRAGRNSDELQVLPVTKTHSLENLKSWLSISAFPKTWGENYFSELEQKQKQAEEQNLHIQWHYIGPLQSRKIRDIAQVVSCIQSVSRVKELEILKSIKEAKNRIPDFYLQVNVSGELQKNGVSVKDFENILKNIDQMGLKKECVGLMCLPESLETASERELREQFSTLRKTRDEFLPSGKLSMGMSGDFEWAIEEGSNLIRVGSVLFGARH
jgi:hypothetical protein